MVSRVLNHPGNPSSYHSYFTEYFQEKNRLQQTSTPCRALRSTIAENKFSRLHIMGDYVRFAAGSFHFSEGPRFSHVGSFQPCQDFSPFEPFVAEYSFLK